MGTDPIYARTRRFMQRVPGHPCCNMCPAPFGGIGGPLMRLMGRRRWPKNPKYCGICFRLLEEQHGGAEIVVTDVSASAAGFDGSALEHRRLELKGKSVATDVIVIPVGREASVAIGP